MHTTLHTAHCLHNAPWPASRRSLSTPPSSPAALASAHRTGAVRPGCFHLGDGEVSLRFLWRGCAGSWSTSWGRGPGEQCWRALLGSNTRTEEEYRAAWDLLQREAAQCSTYLDPWGKSWSANWSRNAGKLVAWHLLQQISSAAELGHPDPAHLYSAQPA